MSVNRISIERRAASVQSTFKPIPLPRLRGVIVQFMDHQHHRKIRSEGGTIILFDLELLQIVEDRQGLL